MESDFGQVNKEEEDYTPIINAQYWAYEQDQKNVASLPVSSNN